MEDIYLVNFIHKNADTGPRLTLLKGIVFDEKTTLPLGASLEITDNETGNKITTVTSNTSSGKYMISLPAGKNYGISISSEGYLFESVNINMPDSLGYNEYERDIPLRKLEVGVKVVLNNIFYDFDRSNLRSESVSELERLVDMLKKNPSVKIELSSHTDSRGSDEYNLKLSQDRAQSVVSFLNSKGVSNDRLVAKGYGEAQPVATNDTEEGRQFNRRTEFKILSK
jgi:outer membrane protein OmpA-like peptidoglycan-associated protein